MREWGFHVMHIVFKCNILIYACTLGSLLIWFRARSFGDHYSLIHLVSFVFFEWYYGSDDSMFVHFILQCKLSSFVHKPWGASSYYLEQSSWSYHNIYLSFGIFLVVHLVACFICWSFLTLLSFCNLWSYL